jgi:hypothetical protein
MDKTLRTVSREEALWFLRNGRGVRRHKGQVSRWASMRRAQSRQKTWLQEILCGLKKVPKQMGHLSPCGDKVGCNKLLIAFEVVPLVCLSCHATTAFKVPLRVKMMTMRSLKRVVALPDIKVETEDIRTRSKRKMMSLSMAMIWSVRRRFQYRWPR